MSATPPVRLLAIDIDGTLLRRDGQIAAADRQAIAAAQRAGVTVTLATGRLSSSTVPVARDLAIDVPLVCADGAVLYCPRREQPLAQVLVSAADLQALLAMAADHRLAPFVFTHATVTGHARDFARYGWVAGWTPRAHATQDMHGSLAGPLDWQIVTAIAVGAGETVRAVQADLLGITQHSAVDVFPIGDTGDWVVRVMPANCTKADGLAHLADQMGIGADQVAAIGDWINDVPMLGWAGRSFAMGHAPDTVKRAAQVALSATADEGGGVAEALVHLGMGTAPG